MLKTKKIKQLLTLLTTMLLTASMMGSTVVLAQSDDCKGPTVDAQQNITMSCVAIDGNLYRGVLNPVGTDEWKFNLDEYGPSTCSWHPDLCVTVTPVPNLKTRAMEIAQVWEAKLPKLKLKGQIATTVLRYIPHSHPEEPEGYYWTFVKKLVVPPNTSGTSGATPGIGSPQGFSNSYGTLKPYTLPSQQEGTGKKLLAIYMVGSDLESDGLAGTNDFIEFIEGYQKLSNSNLDIIVAFGGANKKGWRGMKFANMAQILKDSEDGQFGNLDDYLYQEDRAHMGDKNSLQLFLSYVKEGYVNYQPRTLVFWDHGASYEGFGNDENYDGDGLSLEEIDTALRESQVGKFELIGFDACLMASAEVAQIIKNHANYLLASEELEPGHGWNWSTVISAYSAHTDVVDAAIQIIDNFVDDNAYPEGETQDGKTLSVVDLSQFDAVVEAFSAFASSGVTNSSKDALIQAYTKSREYGIDEKSSERTSIDWKHFAELIKTKIQDADQQQKLDHFIAAIDTHVKYAKDDGSRPNSYGLSFGGLETGNKTDPLSQANADFRTTFLDIKNNDTTPPTVVQQDTNVPGTDLMSTPPEGAFVDNGTTTNTEGAPRVQQSRFNVSFLNGERAAFVHFPLQTRALTTVKGIAAEFSDENLTRVTTIFGNVLPLSVGEGDKMVDHLWAVAKVEAYPSDKKPGFYFTPQWNQKWYTVEFDANQDTEWMPMVFQFRYQKDGKTYTYYSAEIDYIKADYAKLIQIDKDGQLVQQGTDEEGYPIYAKDEKGNYVDPIEFARLDIIVDDQNVVVDHTIRPYQIMYTGEAGDEGHVQFDRATYRLQQGDIVSFYARAINLETKEDNWVISDKGYITFTQAPKFIVEELLFEDETGQLLNYYYAMQAEDIAGNVTLTELGKMAEK